VPLKKEENVLDGIKLSKLENVLFLYLLQHEDNDDQCIAKKTVEDSQR